jgi:hypothetical protein
MKLTEDSWRTHQTLTALSDNSSVVEIAERSGGDRGSGARRNPIMATVMRADAEVVPSTPYVTVMGRLLVAALLLIPLAAMLFPELNHRSGNRASASGQATPAARSSVEDPLRVPSPFTRSEQ